MTQTNQAIVVPLRDTVVKEWDFEPCYDIQYKVVFKFSHYCLFNLSFYLFFFFVMFQVKVWFQNRRTKHKRVQQEEEAKAQQQQGGGNNGSGNGNGNKNTHHVSKWQQDTGDYHNEDEDDEDSELIDPKAEDCSSGSEA